MVAFFSRTKKVYIDLTLGKQEKVTRAAAAARNTRLRRDKLRTTRQPGVIVTGSRPTPGWRAKGIPACAEWRAKSAGFTA